MQNEISINLSGKGSLLYQIVGKYYEPWKEEIEIAELLGIDVTYDRTNLKKDETVTAYLKVENKQPARADMVMVDLGIPPGFTVIIEDLEVAKNEGKIERYSLTGRQVTIYLDHLEAGEVLEMSIQMKSEFPLVAKSPKSSVYQYYNPEIRGTAAPVEFTVE